MKKRRFLSLLLTLSLCAGLLVSPAGASEAEEIELTQEQLDYVEGVEQMFPNNTKARAFMESTARHGAERLRKAAEEANAATDLINDVVDMSPTFSKILYLKENGELWFSGKVSSYEAAAFGLEEEATLTPVFLMDQVAKAMLTVNGGIILKTDGTLLGWGDSVPSGFSDTGALVPLMDGVVDAAAYSYCVLAEKADNSLWGFGSGLPRRLGRSSNGEAIWPAIKLMDDVDQFWCPRDESVYVLKTDGTLWQQGIFLPGNIKNQSESSTQFVQIGENVQSFGCYDTLRAYIKTDGSLWTWQNFHHDYNSNQYGQLGRLLGQGEDSSIPGKAMDNVRQIAVGSHYALAVKTDGSLWVWGENFYGNLGDGWNKSTSVDGTPCIEKPYQLMGNVKKVYTSDSNSFVILDDGSLYGWGSDFPMVTGVESLYNRTTHHRSTIYCQTTPYQLGTGSGTAYPSFQQVDIDGKKVEFQCYALKDSNGNLINYVKVRDLSLALDGSPAQFAVTWDGYINLFKRKAARPNGSENSTPFSGERPYRAARTVTGVDYNQADLHSFVLTDDQGGGYTYYQLRDLGRALDFNVGWSAGKGVFIETDKPYDPNN